MTRPINASGRPPPALAWEPARRKEYADPAAVTARYHVPEILLAGILVVLGGPVARRAAPENDWWTAGSLLLLVAAVLLALFAVAQLLRDPHEGA